MSLTSVGAALCWVAAFALVGIDLALGIGKFGPLAMLIGAAGATLTVRCYLLQLSHSLRERERNAFELGMDAGQARHLR